MTEFKEVTPGSDFWFDGDKLYMTDMTGEKVVRLDIRYDLLGDARSAK